MAKAKKKGVDYYKVKALKLISGPEGNHHVGEIFVLDEYEAEELHKDGAVEVIGEADQPVVEEPEAEQKEGE